MKFFVTYQMPHAGLDEWMKLPEEMRKAQEEKMKEDWNAWMSTHKDVITDTAGVGRPKRITSGGVADARNDLMLISFVEAPSIEEASKMFEGHPHFGIPGASIEVMPVNTAVG
jgi:predicted aconitase